MNVIWYNTSLKSYQFGTYEEYKINLTGTPETILALERFKDASEKTLMKIVSELNKCQLSKLR